MPPASLSTLEVIRPGPTTARKRPNRRRSRRVRLRRAMPRSRQASTLAEMTVQSIAGLVAQEPLTAAGQPGHHVVHSDGTDRPPVLLHHAQAAQIVLVKQVEDLLVF